MSTSLLTIKWPLAVKPDGTTFRLPELKAWLRVPGEPERRLDQEQTDDGDTVQVPVGIAFDLEWTWTHNDETWRAFTLGQTTTYDVDSTARLSARRTADDQGDSKVELLEPPPCCPVPARR